MVDEWNGFAVLLANMIEKYAAKHNTTKNVYKENVETSKAA